MRIPKWLADLGWQLHRQYYKQLLPYQCAKIGDWQQSWFDHRIDLYYHWPHNLFWMERGLYARRLMNEGCQVLDLCCGDGFFSFYFYASIAEHIDAIDIDPRAIEHARRLYTHPRITWWVRDIVTQDFPQDSYDVITWYEALDHFSEDQYRIVIERIKRAIGVSGVLVGSVGLPDNPGKAHWEHQNEFTEPGAVQSFLERDFLEVDVFMTTFPLHGGGMRRTAHFTVRKPRLHQASIR